MAGLTWSDDDGFDAGGRRVASVIAATDNAGVDAVQGGAGPGFFAPRRFWEAYVAHDGRFEVVVVDGRPGRWADPGAARAAATAAYDAWTSAHPSPPQDVVDADAVDERRKAFSVAAATWSFVRACFVFRRPGRRRPRPAGAASPRRASNS